MKLNLDVILFQIFPYVALILMLFESIRRYRQTRFTFSSLSSQFFESEQLFLGSVPWHYGIGIVFLGHLIGFLFPRQLLAFSGVPVRLYVIETVGLTGALLALIGLINLAVRRLRSARLRTVTTPMDLVVLAVLLAQVCLGVYIATCFRWGSSWYAIALVPYLRSLFVLQPNVTLLVALPWVVKLHVLGFFVFLAVLSYSRLVHLLVIPLQYIGRPPQLVVWNRAPEAIASTGAPESAGPPRSHLRRKTPAGRGSGFRR